MRELATYAIVRWWGERMVYCENDLLCSRAEYIMVCRDMDRLGCGYDRTTHAGGIYGEQPQMVCGKMGTLHGA